MIHVVSRSTVGHRVGGLETYVDDQVRLLKCLGYSVQLVTTPGMSEAYREDLRRLDIEISLIPAISSRYTAEWYRNLSALFAANVGETAIFHGLAGVGYKGHGRLITVTHGSPPLSIYNAGLGAAGCRGSLGRVKSFLRTAEPWGLRKHEFVSLSQYDADLTRISYLASRDRVHVIPPFVGVGSSRGVVRKRQMCFVGRLEESKGILDLVKAWREIGPISGYNLLVVGEGSSRALAEALKVPNVVYAGAQSRDQVASHIGSSMWVVVPSRVRESFGLSAVEALREGTPVIFRQRGALPNVIQRGGIGYRGVDDLSTALLKAISLLPSEWSEFSEKASSRFTEIGGDSNAAAWTKLLERGGRA